jgi:hypothetical protein
LPSFPSRHGDASFFTLTPAHLANGAHSAGEGEVRRLLELALQIGEGQYGWGFYGLQTLYQMIEFNENIDALHTLLKRPKINVNCWNKDVLAPLHFAALKNQEFVVKLLMDRSDLDMNATADFDLTLPKQTKPNSRNPSPT